MAETDITLLARYARLNDAVAFDQLARRYRNMVFATARRVIGNHHDAEDIAQVCFLELARSASAIRFSVPAYLHRAATRRAIDLMRERSRQRDTERKAATERISDSNSANPAEMPWEEISPVVDEAIDELPDDLKTIVILYYLRGLTEAEIALEMGTSRRTVVRRMSVGVRRLRAGLLKKGYPVPMGMLALRLRAEVAHVAPSSLTAETGRMALAAVLRPAPAMTTVARFALLEMLQLRWVGLATLAAILLGGGSLAMHAARSGHAAENPYDRLNQVYAPYLSKQSPSGFAWHTASMQQNPTAFWRGSQPLFFAWCKEHCGDWLASQDNFLLCGLSPNLADSGRLPADVNSDFSVPVPFQVELLQGLISLRLAASYGFDAQDSGSVAAIAAEMCGRYESGLLNPADHLAVENGERGADRDLTEYLDSQGSFAPLVRRQEGELLQFDFLRPFNLSTEAATEVLRGALYHSPALVQFIGDANPRVLQVRQRTRFDSVVTQGQASLLVLLDGSLPLERRILEIKQQTPSPAELAGAAARDSRPAGERVAQNAQAMAGDELPIGWCEIGGDSWSIRPFEPGDDLHERGRGRWSDPFTSAALWATGIASSHRADPRRVEIAGKLTPQLQKQLVERSSEYIASMLKDFEAFRSDPRAFNDQTTEYQELSSLLNDALHPKRKDG